MRLTLLVALIAVAMFILSSPAVAVDLKGCELAGVDGPVRCGTLVVPETTGDEARTLEVAIVVLGARTSSPQPDPLVVIQGGPGQSAISLADFYAETFARVRSERDIVLVDQRGTGESAPLMCSLASAEDPQAGLDDMLPPPAIGACRQRLEQAADLGAYGTVAAMQDLDRVRKALGYEKINLYGTSYGSLAALVYVDRYPGSVRSLVLKGVAPPELLGPVNYAEDAQVALDAILDACAADAACHGAFGNVRETLARLQRRLDEAPASVEWRDPDSDRVHRLRLTREVLADTLRTRLYAPFAAVRIPALIHRAAGGDYQEVVAMRLQYLRGASQHLAFGMFLSVTCKESLPFIDAAEVERTARETVFGAYRYRQQAAACKLWPVRPQRALDADFTSTLPALLVSGELDPVTPPRWAERLRHRMPNARHLIVANASHSFDNMAGCVENVIADFVSRGAAGELDVRCAGAIELPDFPAE